MKCASCNSGALSRLSVQCFLCLDSRSGVKRLIKVSFSASSFLSRTLQLRSNFVPWLLRPPHVDRLLVPAFPQVISALLCYRVLASLFVPSWIVAV